MRNYGVLAQVFCAITDISARKAFVSVHAQNFVLAHAKQIPCTGMCDITKYARGRRTNTLAFFFTYKGEKAHFLGGHCLSVSLGLCELAYAYRPSTGPKKPKIWLLT